MGRAISTWLVGTKNVYIGNAATVRDYRVQLRGSRSVLLFGIYLAVLIFVAMWVYLETSRDNNLTIVAAQRQLEQFSQAIMWLLAAAVGLIAPGLTATSVVTERQRQSLDLVFSAPVTPKYYLVGKMLSSWRYTWMILILALPITATSIVLGGASWADVLIAYLMLSLQGLMMTSVALLMSTIAAKPVGAIIWSYGAVFLYYVFIAPLSSSVSFSRMFGGARGNEAPWWITLSPMSVLDSAKTVTTIGTHAIPNWIFMVAFSLLFTKIILLGAGSILIPAGGKEIVGLRIHALIYVLAISIWLGWSVDSPRTTSRVMPGMRGSSSTSYVPSTDDTALRKGQAFAYTSASLILFVPFVACFGYDRERRYWPNGLFSFRRILDGTPSGGFPFLVALAVTSVIGWSLCALAGDLAPLQWQFWALIFYTCAFWTFFWSLGRLLSSFFAGLKTSRTMLFAAFLFLVCLPFPFLLVFAGDISDRSSSGAWNFYILSPLLSSQSDREFYAITLSLILGFLSALMLFVSEDRVKKKQATIRNYDDQPYETV